MGGLLEPIPALIGQRQGSTLEESPVRIRIHLD